MTIIETKSIDGYHTIEEQSHRRACWLDGYIEVPPHLEEAVWATSGYCDLLIEDGVLTGITPLPIPEPEPVPPVIDPLTETQLAMAELAQVVEDNNTATQLAIAELAGALLGG